MKNIVTNFGQFLNENFAKGDLVKLLMKIERDDDDDGEYGCSIDEGEIGEIRYIVGDFGEIHNKGREENVVYMIKFPDDKNKQGSLCKGRYIQLTKASLEKVNK